MKRFSFFTAAFFLFAVSCSNSGQVTSSATGENTLKSKVSVKSEAAIWTSELEKNILTENLSENPYIGKSVSLKPETMNVSSAFSEKEKIYPELKGFGSLDSDDLKKESRQLVSDFCNDLINGKDLYASSKYVAKEKLFSYVFFADDLRSNIDSGDSEIRFSKFYIGKSFLSGKEVQIPVRLYVVSGAKYVDLSIFVSEVSSEITQIKIENIEK